MGTVFRDRKGTEVLQTLIIIAVVGAAAVLITSAFIKSLRKSVPEKIKGDTEQTSAQDSYNIARKAAQDSRQTVLRK